MFTGLGYVPEEIEVTEGDTPEELVPLEAAEVAEILEGEVVDQEDEDGTD